MKRNKNKWCYFFIKRLVDILISLIGLVFLLPVIILVKILNILTGDFGPLFYSHERIGLNGKKFRLYKFRTMKINADEMLFKLLKENKELAKEYKKNKKLNNDPRITKLGKFLRNSSIDELPQIINILKNDMSLIGNRPYLPREKEDMEGFYKDIIKTKPGLTGYWQVNGRNDVSFQKRLELEQYYSNNCGLLIDIQIFFKTFIVVLKGSSSKTTR
jgi:undecaprenyl-phosphate galactose phosphotransferase